MNDDELRALIRAAIQKHMGGEPAAPVVRLKPDAAARELSLSFGQYQIERPAGDTMCIIEPAVHCNHCGFCKCHGH